MENVTKNTRRGRPRKEDIEGKDSIYDKKEEIIKDEINNKICDDLVDLGLTAKEQDFVLYYLECQNAGHAYMKAYAGTESAKKYATIKGFQQLHRPHIQSAIKRMKKIMSIGYDVDPSKYIETQLKIANADIGDYIKFSEEEIPMYNEDGTLMFDPDTGEQKFKKVNRMHLVDSDTVDTSIIVSIKQGRDGITIQLPDKMKAWENIKNFFEWKAQKEKETNCDSGIIEAITNSAKGSWNEENMYDELDEAMKDES